MTAQALYVDDVLHDCALTSQHTVAFQHPLTFDVLAGERHVRALSAALGGLFASNRIVHRWVSPQVSAVSWLGAFDDREVLGVTVAQRSDDHVDVQILLGAYPAALRARMQEVSAPSYPASAWQLPDDSALPAIAPDEVLDAKLPFQLSDDAQLSSPVAIKPICGRAQVELISSHTVAVYGTRHMGPRLSVGPAMLSLWTGSVGGAALEVANVIHWNPAKQVDSMTMAMRPWPVVKRFQAQMRARTQALLDDSYFDRPAADRMEASPC